jgi:Glycerophosphoryl diester phosphodiesterase family
LLAVVAMAPHQLPAITAGSLKGYIREVPSESSAEREARHRKIAERRAGPIIMVHRGASAFAPENTLEAYAAAIDYGADGCEMDLRRTADGVLVLFHDDMLDHLTDGFGSVNQLTYYELLSLTPRFRRDPSDAPANFRRGPGARPPTGHAAPSRCQRAKPRRRDRQTA